MKKNVLMQIPALMLVIAGFLFTFQSCSDDDDDPTPVDKTETEEPQAEKDPTVSLKFSFDAPEDMTDMFELTGSYVDSTGKVVSEKIVKLPWEKELKDYPLPYSSDFKVTGVKKEGFTPTKEQYVFGKSYVCSYD